MRIMNFFDGIGELMTHSAKNGLPFRVGVRYCNHAFVHILLMRSRNNFLSVNRELDSLLASHVSCKKGNTLCRK